MKQYQIHYYIDREPYRYDFIFNSLWAATFKARAIMECHGVAADVMDCETGEILAIFEPNGKIWTQTEIVPEVRILAHTPLE